MIALQQFDRGQPNGWKSVLLAALACALLLWLVSCGGPAPVERPDRQRLESIAAQSTAASLSAAALAGEAKGLQAEADQADIMAVQSTAAGRDSEAAEHRADARARRAEAAAKAREAAALDAVAIRGQALVAAGRVEIAKEEAQAREDAHQEARRATLDHLVTALTWVGGIAAAGALVAGLVLRMVPWGALVPVRLLAGVGAAGLGLVVLAQTLGAAAPWMPVCGLVALVALVAWLGISLGHRGHAATASAAGLADALRDLLDDACEQLPAPLAVDLRARVDAHLDQAGKAQQAAGVHQAVQRARLVLSS